VRARKEKSFRFAGRRYCRVAIREANRHSRLRRWKRLKSGLSVKSSALQRPATMAAVGTFASDSLELTVRNGRSGRSRNVDRTPCRTCLPFSCSKPFQARSSSGSQRRRQSQAAGSTQGPTSTLASELDFSSHNLGYTRTRTRATKANGPTAAQSDAAQFLLHFPEPRSSIGVSGWM